jgi:hypothetical protein
LNSYCVSKSQRLHLVPEDGEAPILRVGEAGDKLLTATQDSRQMLSLLSLPELYKPTDHQSFPAFDSHCSSDRLCTLPAGDELLFTDLCRGPYGALKQRCPELKTVLRRGPDRQQTRHSCLIQVTPFNSAWRNGRYSRKHPANSPSHTEAPRRTHPSPLLLPLSISKHFSVEDRGLTSPLGISPHFCLSRA